MTTRPDVANLVDAIGDPASPRWTVPASVVPSIPGLKEALAAHAKAVIEAHAAADAPEDYETDFLRLQAERHAAITAAGRAAALGTKRPTIPSVPSDEEFATEVTVLVVAARAKKSAADRTAAAVDRLVEEHAEAIAVAVVPSFVPAVDKAAEALATAREAINEAGEALQDVLAFRAAGIAKTSGRRPVPGDLAGIVEALTRGGDPGELLKVYTAHGQPWTLFEGLDRYLGALRAFDLHAGAAHMDMLPPGVNVVAALKRTDAA